MPTMRGAEGLPQEPQIPSAAPSSSSNSFIYPNLGHASQAFNAFSNPAPIPSRRTMELKADNRSPAAFQPNRFLQSDMQTPSMLLNVNDDPPIQSLSRLHGRARAGTLPSSWHNNQSLSSADEQPISQSRFMPNQVRSLNPIGSDANTSRPSQDHPQSRWKMLANSQPGTPFDYKGDDFNAALDLDPANESARGVRPAMTFRQINESADYARRNGASLSLQLNPISTSKIVSHDDHIPPLQEHRARSGTIPGLSPSTFNSSMFNPTWTDRPLSGSNPATESSMSRRSSTLASQSSSSLTGGAGQDLLKNASSATFTPQSDFLNYAANPFDRDGALEDHRGLSPHQGQAYRNAPSGNAQRNRASTLASVAPTSTRESHTGTTAMPSFSSLDDDAVRVQDFYDALAAQSAPTTLPAQAQGRHRAGTVAALGGPGSRHRVEREILRMASSGTLTGQEMSTLLANLDKLSMSIDRGSAPNAALIESFSRADLATPPPSISGRPSPFLTSPSTPTGLGNARNAALSGTLANRESSPAVNQVPSRSLWIGNLSSSTTGQELMYAFAPYGAIESLRLLPEKECGFVNFVELNDAVRAREDILTVKGGKIESLGTGVSGTVRIGFGKIDAAPHSNFRTSSGVMSSESTHHHPPPQQEEFRGNSIGAAGSDGGAPTRALWIGSVPESVTQAALLNVFHPFGPIESARILTHKNCAFVNFERVEDAMRARKILNGREILGTEVGAIRIGFAKVPSRGNEKSGFDDIDAMANVRRAGEKGEDSASAGNERNRSALLANVHETQASRRPDATQQHIQALSRGLGVSASNSIVPASDKGGVPLPAHMVSKANVNDVQLLMRELSWGDPDADADVASINDVGGVKTYYMTIPLVSEVTSGKQFETSRLREIRRGIESGQYATSQCDHLAHEYMTSIDDLASDYIGNTLVQKFFEACSEDVKLDMLQRLAPHLAMIGCHKNGTWAAQKILDCTISPGQIELIARNLRPYVPGLLLDNFGNYVVQCCLAWTKHNDFVFDAMVDRCWEIAQGRFGARSMRACLENPNVSKRQKKRVAIAVILTSVPLATSPNGSILLTWLLETSGLSKSFRLLAPRFVPHLVHLCTHKLASGIVLRLASQRAEPEASQTIIHGLFEADDHDAVLEEIVTDQVHGSQFITKILSSGVMRENQRAYYAEQVKVVLRKHHLVGVPAYRRLCEDLGFLPEGGSVSAPRGLNEASDASLTFMAAPPHQFAPGASMAPLLHSNDPATNFKPAPQGLFPAMSPIWHSGPSPPLDGSRQASPLAANGPL